MPKAAVGVCMNIAAIERLTEATFDAQASSGHVLVEFGATWCMPCRMLEPVIRQLAASYTGRVRVMTVDTDEETALVTRFSVSTVPTILVLQDGEVTRRFVGLTTYKRLAQAIETTSMTDENATGT